MNKKVMSIIVVVAVIVIIIGIWLVKNNVKKEDEVAKNNTSNTTQNENPDFKLNITSSFSLDKLKEYNLPIIIDFGSDSCIPCKQMAPALKQLNSELQEKAIIRFVDVWKYPKLANNYPIELIPTQIFINSDGTPYAPENAEELELEFIKDENGNHIFTTHIGALTTEQMKSMLKEMGLNE